MTTTNWEQIEKRARESERALDYMREHPLTHEEAVEQTKRLKSKNLIFNEKICIFKQNENEL